MSNEDTVKQKLSSLGYEFNSLCEKDILYLCMIEEAISEIFEREEKAKKLMTNNNLSINNISDKTGISRQTIYNRKILQEYINISQEVFRSGDLSSIRIMHEEKIIQLKKEIDALRVRDCKIEELKHDISTLKGILKDREQEIARLSQSVNNFRCSNN